MGKADYKIQVTLQKPSNSGRIAYRKELYQNRQEETNEEQNQETWASEIITDTAIFLS